MACKRCPHHVRHGKMASDGVTIVYSDLCSLRLKRVNQLDEPPPRKVKGRQSRAPETSKCHIEHGKIATSCLHIPFPLQFDYVHCQVYQETFATKGLKNGVIPTKDVQYSPYLVGIAVTDMELL
jgi:hypothetical protein